MVDHITETATRGVLYEKVFLEILQNSMENICARASFFNKVTGISLQLYFKKRLRPRSFPVNFAKFLRTLIYFTEHLGVTASDIKNMLHRVQTFLNM